MRTPFTSSRAMALTLALDARDDGVGRTPYRARRRLRRHRGASPDGRRG